MVGKNHKPVTRAELRAELKAALRPYVTQASLERILQRYVTKNDLKKALSRCATKEDLTRFATREDLKATRRDLEAAIAKCATKEDLKATRRDLEAAIAKCATKVDLKATRRDMEAAIAKCATKEDLAIVAEQGRRNSADIHRLVLTVGQILDRLDDISERMATKDQLSTYVSAVDKVSKDNEILWNKHLVQDDRLRTLEEGHDQHDNRIAALEHKGPSPVDPSGGRPEPQPSKT